MRQQVGHETAGGKGGQELARVITKTDRQEIMIIGSKLQGGRKYWDGPSRLISYQETGRGKEMRGIYIHEEK